MLPALDTLFSSASRGMYSLIRYVPTRINSSI